MEEPLWSEVAEQSVLGSVLIRPSIVGQVAGLLRVDDFFLPAHRVIFEAMLGLKDRGAPVDVIPLWELLKAEGTAKMVPDAESYMVRLAGAVPTAENFVHYARIVSSHAAIRTLEAVLASASAGVRRDPESAVDKLREASRLLIRACVGQTGEGEPVAVIANRIADEIEQASKGEMSPRVPTGIRQLDHRLNGGLRPGLVVPMGLTGMGKSSLGLQVAFRGAAENKVPALVFWLEAEPADAVRKGAALVTRTATDDLEPVPQNLATWKRVHKTLGAVSELSHLVRIEQVRSLNQICSVATSWRSEHPGPRALIVVDHLQKVQARMSRKGANREQEVAYTAETLQNMALDLKVPLISPAQMDNDAAKENRPPRLGDSRESKAIEHEATCCIGIHRDRGLSEGPAELIVLKSRFGSLGPVKVEWVGSWQGFEDEGYQWDRRYEERRFADAS